jgi:ParB-like nuclease domain
MTRKWNGPTYSDEVYLRRISVGDRLRKLDKGKVDKLAASIAESGLLQPIVVAIKKDGGRGYMLIAGRHRLEAVKQLGRKTIKAEVAHTRRRRPDSKNRESASAPALFNTIRRYAMPLPDERECVIAQVEARGASLRGEAVTMPSTGAKRMERTEK